MGLDKKISVLLVLAFALRLVLLNEKALGVDEAVTFNILHMNFSEAIQFVLQDFRPPMYYSVIWLANAISLFAAKLFGVLVGTATVFLVYKIGRMEFGEKTALLAGSIAAIHPFLIGYSQHLRESGLVIFLFLLSLWFLLKNLRMPTLRNKIGWITAGVLLLYTSYIGLVLLGSEALFGLVWHWRKKSLTKQWAGIAIPALVSLVFFLPMLTLLLTQASGILAARIFERSILDFGYLFAKFSSGFTLGFMQENLFLLVPVALLNLGFWGSVVVTLKNWKESNKAVLTIFFILLALFVLAAIKFPLFLNYRYLSFLTPLFIIISASFFAGLSNKNLKKLLVALLLIGLLYSVFTYYMAIQISNWDAWFGL